MGFPLGAPENLCAPAASDIDKKCEKKSMV
jgi:hypothetical protein